MRIKGTAYHARMNLLRAKLGEAGVEDFMKSFLAKHPTFPQNILATTWLPAEDFLQLIDAIVEGPYNGDTQSLWEIGEASATYTLTAGPYRHLLETRDVRRFGGLAGVMYANFFDTGRARSEYCGKFVELWIEGIPAPLRHLYFEYSLVGYFRRGFELLEESVRAECLQGYSKGDDRVHYRIHPA